MGLMSISELQEILSISRSTAYRLHERGQIRFVHVGRAVRVPREDVTKLLEALVN